MSCVKTVCALSRVLREEANAPVNLQRKQVLWRCRRTHNLLRKPISSSQLWCLHKRCLLQKSSRRHYNRSTTLTYADCNAIAPQTVRTLGDVITAAGGTFVDASIIGPPPRTPGATRFYASGPQLDTFSELNNYGLDVRTLGDEIGHASAIKMCYASLTKGLTALCTELLTAASLLGVSEALTTEFQLSQSALFERMERGLPSMPPKARRWIGEMEEISATFVHVGLTPNILTGAADMYRFVGDTHLADLPPEARDEFPTLAELIEILAGNLKSN